MSIIDKTSLVMIPSGYKDSKLYSVKPRNGGGDFTFTRASSATRVNADGYIDDVAIAVPRLDYSGNATYACLLMEPQRTNFVNYSEDFSQGITSNCSVATSTITSPANDQTAYKLTEDNTQSIKIFRAVNTSATIAGNVYSSSIFIKAAERTKVRVYGYHLSNQNFYVDYDLSDNSYLNSGSTNTTLFGYSIEDFGNGWKRITVSGSKSNRTYSFDVGVSPLDDNGNVNYLGDGTSGLYIWGGQFEEGTFPTSYIPTIGATSTRVADVCNNAGDATVFNSSEGVLFAEIAALADDGTNRVISISDGTNSNKVLIYYTPVTNQLTSVYTYSGSQQVIINITLSDSTQFTKCAFKYKENDCAFWVNGVEVGTDISSTELAPNTLNTLNFDNGVGSADFYGKCKQLMVFNEALTDEELEELTTI